MRSFVRVVFLLACLLVLGLARTLAQTSVDRFSISGMVTDPTGAGIPGASVSAQRNSGPVIRSTRADGSGAFRLIGLPAGDLDLQVQSDGFAPQSLHVSIARRSPSPLRIALKLAGVRQEVTVSESAAAVSTTASDNLDVITLDRQMLDSLPIFDQNYVAAMSQFLDPGSIGTGGVTLVVDGMEQKNIGVSASAIQQVKINQNPYSAEFSRPGRGRIEILTKPGSQVYHGTFNFVFRDYHLNARDVFAVLRPPEQRRIYEGSLVGPLGKGGRNSFQLSANREEEDVVSLVFAESPTGIVQQNVPAPRRNTEFSAGATHQFGENHLASIRGSYRDITSDKPPPQGGGSGNGL